MELCICISCCSNFQNLVVFIFSDTSKYIYFYCAFCKFCLPTSSKVYVFLNIKLATNVEDVTNWHELNTLQKCFMGFRSYDCDGNDRLNMSNKLVCWSLVPYYKEFPPDTFGTQ